MKNPAKLFLVALPTLSILSATITGSVKKQSFTQSSSANFPPDLAFTMPTHPPQTTLVFTMPTHPPQANLAFTVLTRPPLG